MVICTFIEIKNRDVNRAQSDISVGLVAGEFFKPRKNPAIAVPVC